jgi:hypothetical protein
VRRFATILIRLIGFGSLVVSVWGFVYMFDAFRTQMQRQFVAPTGLDEPNHHKAAFLFLTAVTAIMLGAVILVGIKLLRFPYKGIAGAKLVFLGEITVFFLLVILPLGPSIAVAFGIGLIGLAPQLFSAFPLVALFLLLVADFAASRRHPPVDDYSHRKIL